MKRPDASLHNPSPRYLRGLVASSGLNQQEVAALIGVSDRMMRYYLAEEGSPQYREAPYLVQYAMEGLAAKTD